MVDAVIVGAVILPELFVPVVILLVEVNVACFVFKLDSNCPIFVPTLVLPYYKLLDAVIIGSLIFPELSVPVFILLVEVNVACFVFKLVSNYPILVPTLVLP